jgi:hypothetical protein
MYILEMSRGTFGSVFSQREGLEKFDVKYDKPHNGK